MINETYILYAILAANMLLLLIACGALLHINARCRRLEEFKLSIIEQPAAVPVAPDDSAQLAALGKLERRLAGIEQSILSTSTGAVAEPRTARPSLPIENALRMAKQGASIDDLTRSCGLNIGEARLLQKLHGRAQIAGAGG